MEPSTKEEHCETKKPDHKGGKAQPSRSNHAMKHLCQYVIGQGEVREKTHAVHGRGMKHPNQKGNMYCRCCKATCEDMGMTNKARTKQKGTCMRTPQYTYQKEPNSTASVKYVTCEC